MEHFIYVFNKDDANALADMQFKMLYSNEASGCFIFLNKDRMDFASLPDVTYVMSDVLTFDF